MLGVGCSFLSSLSITALLLSCRAAMSSSPDTEEEELNMETVWLVVLLVPSRLKNPVEVVLWKGVSPVVPETLLVLGNVPLL